MTENDAPQPRIVNLQGLDLEQLEGGAGPRLLVLHDYDYLNVWHPYLNLLGRDCRVLAPTHPGFGRSELPPDFTTVADLAYLYLDLLRDADRPTVVLGLGFGGWVAAEMAVRDTRDISALILADAFGVKHGGRLDREIADTFILSPAEIIAMTWHDPALGARLAKLPGHGELEDDELLSLLRSRQGVTLFGWKPFLHNPGLKRWLHRIDRPTLLLWGESDRLVAPEYGRKYAEAIRGARFQLIEQAGHYPYLEQPERFVAAVSDFLRSIPEARLALSRR